MAVKRPRWAAIDKKKLVVLFIFRWKFIRSSSFAGRAQTRKLGPTFENM